MRYVDGRIEVPAGPGLGVTLDKERVAQHAELYREVGGYAYDRDPGRPGWYPLVPNDRWADPAAELRLIKGPRRGGYGSARAAEEAPSQGRPSDVLPKRGTMPR